VISPNTLNETYDTFSGDNFNFYKVVFKEEDMVKPKQGDFDLQDYYDHPEKYLPQFERYIPYLDILVNCIYWTEDYPRLLTKKYLQNKTKSKSNLALKVVGDISCDIDGAVEITYKPTKPDNPTFTYFANADDNDGRFEDGIHPTGITVMAVDNLPCEFSRASSLEFSSVLKNFVNDIITADFNQNVKNIKLPYALKKGLILHKGNLTEDYLYIKEFIK
jgi:alpha-aminoadipic semialdehyde synthase